MTTDFLLPQTEIALEDAFSSLRKLQRSLADRLLAEQEAYLKLDESYKVLKTEFEQLQLVLPHHGNTASGYKNNNIINNELQQQVAKALSLIEQALTDLSPNNDVKNKDIA